MSKKRHPVSPHLTIYSFPLSALSSITVRVTGVALYGGIMLMGGLEVFGVSAADFAVDNMQASPYLPMYKTIITFPLAYHYLGGVRHAYWDRVPESVTNEGVERSCWAVFAGTAVAVGVGVVV